MRFVRNAYLIRSNVQVDLHTTIIHGMLPDDTIDFYQRK